MSAISARPRLMERAVGLLSAIAISGCAVSTLPMPDLDGRLAVKVSREKLSSRRFGAHQIAGTSIYVSGHQGAAELGMLFGPIGLLAGHAAAQSTGEKKVRQAEPHLRLDVPAFTERVVAEALARRVDVGRFAAAGGAGVATLEIKPYVVVNFIGNDQARLWVVLQTALTDTSRRWKMQYISGVGDPRAIAGDDGWAAHDGAVVREAVNRNLRLAVDLLLRDASHDLARDPARRVTVRGHWLWMKEPRARPAIVLEETGEALAVLPCAYEDDANGFAHTGVTILDRRAIDVTRESGSTQPCFGKHLDIN